MLPRIVLHRVYYVFGVRHAQHDLFHGHDYFLNTYQAREILDFDPIPVETTIRDTASYLEKYL